MLRDLRQAWRSLRARRALTATVVLTLGIGIGANTLLFAVVDAAMLRPFTFPDPQRLVGVGAGYPKLHAPLDFFESLSGPEYQDIKTGAHLEDVAGFDLGNEPVMIGHTPERIFTAYLWDDLFATLRMPPALGRPFSRAEIDAAAPVAIVSHGFWRERLASSPTVIGSSITIGGRLHQIVGVMPPRTRIYGTDLWIPMPERADALARTRRQFNVLARLAPGESIAQANASLSIVARRIEADFAAAVPEYQGFTLEARSWAQIDVWGGTEVTSVVFAGLALMLLLVTANVSLLLLARAGSRRGEMALKIALGGDPGALARETILESMLQAVIGATLGLAVAAVGIRVLPVWLPGFLPEDVWLTVNGRVLLFAVGVAAASALLAGAVPALQQLRTNPASLLGAATVRATPTPGAKGFQRAIVALEVAIAVVVAGGAALLLVQTRQILSVDPGFDPRGLVMMRLTLPLPKYGGNASMAFFDRLLEEARTLPSVEHASLSNQPPPGLFSRSQFEIDGRTNDAASVPSAFFTTVGAAYRETLAVRLTAGRWFDERAERNGQREVVINDAAARRFFPNENAIGHRIRIIGPAYDNARAEIVGVAADTRNRGLALDSQPEIFASFRQIPERRQSQLYLLVRARQDVETVVRDVRRIVSTLDAQQPIYAVSTVEEQLEDGVAPRRLAAGVLVAFSALALAIAGLGIYGVLSHGVGERTREIGVRLALGAQTHRVRRMIIIQAMVPVALGIVAGTAGLLLGFRVLASWLFGVTPSAGALVTVDALLAAVGLCASALPAWRASRLNPVVALRTD